VQEVLGMDTQLPVGRKLTECYYKYFLAALNALPKPGRVKNCTTVESL